MKQNAILSGNDDWLTIEMVIEGLIEQQKKVILKIGRRIVPNVTAEDLLQPNDFPELEGNGHFRYEEGLLAGMQSVQAALRASKSDIKMAQND